MARKSVLAQNKNERQRNTSNKNNATSGRRESALARNLNEGDTYRQSIGRNNYAEKRKIHEFDNSNAYVGKNRSWDQSYYGSSANTIPEIQAARRANAKARQYQQNLENEAKSYQIDEEARKRNTLEGRSWNNFWKKSDQEYMQEAYDFGGEEAARRAMFDSDFTKDWETKYGKSKEQILQDFLADAENDKLAFGEEHPWLSEAITAINTPIRNAFLTLPSMAANLINPDSDTAKQLEDLRSRGSKTSKQLREGVKLNTGETGDKVLDTVNSVVDRTSNYVIGNAVAPGVGGAVMTGLNEADTRLDDLDLRGVEGRKKYGTALAHGTVEGLGTALTAGWLNKIPGAKNLGGAVWNTVKAATEGAAENAGSEVLHNIIDNTINGDLSEKELNKRLYMMQGYSEEEAENLAEEAQFAKVKQAGLTGALFAGGMKGAGEIGKKIFRRVPDFDVDNNAKVTDPEIENARVQAETAANKIDELQQQIPEAPTRTNADVATNLQENLADVNTRISNLENNRNALVQTGVADKAVLDNIDREMADLVARRDEILTGMERTGVTPEEARVENAVQATSEALENTAKPTETQTPAEQPTLEPAQNNGLKPLEGEELAAEKARIKENNATIKALQDEIEVIKNTPKNKRNGKLTKAAQADVDARMKQIKELKNANKLSKRKIKGTPTPISEQLSKEDYNSIFNYKGNGVETAINYAVKYAGDSAEAKAIAKELRKAVKDLVNSGDMDTYFPKIVDLATRLDEMARTTNAEYSNSIIKTYADYFDDDSLLDKITYNKALHNAWELAQARKTAGAVEPQVEAPEMPNRMPVEEAPVETPNRVPEMGETPAPVENPVPEMETAPPINRVPDFNAPPEEPTGLSQRYYSLKNSDMFQASEAKMALEKAKDAGSFNKGVEARAQAREDAINEFIADPEKTREKNLTKAWDSGKDIDTSMILMHEALENGDQAEFNLNALKQATELKGAGRELRATRDYSGTMEGTLTKGVELLNDKADEVLSKKKVRTQFEKMADNIVDNNDYSALASKLGMDEANIKNLKAAVDAGASKEAITKMLAMYKAVGKVGISEDAIKKIKDIYTEIETRNLNPTSRARAYLEADAYKVLAQDIGGKRSLSEMWNAWRYLAMLGNPKTHLRNIIGNTTHYMVTEAKDALGAVLEGATDKTNRAFGGEGIERTKALLTADDNNLVARTAQDADDVAYAALNDSGSKYNVKNEIDRARNSFNNKAMSKLDDFNSNLLDKEDYSALKRKYSKSLARYLKANGADESIFDATDEASKALLDKARVYAIDQAKQATFHEYSKAAEALTQFSQKLQEGNAAAKFGGAMIEGLVPFKKTPINILKQAIKYSPVSLAKAIKTMGEAISSGNKTATDAIEDLASGLTGTGIMALGYFLASQGLLTGKANENYDVDNAESEQGKQNYAIKIGNKTYTLDWLAPFSLPLFVGSEMHDLMSNGFEDEADAVDKFFTSLATISEPITEMSMLQGIQNALNELSYSRESVLGTLASNTTLGYLSQGIPTLAGQVARAIDPTRRSTYSDKDSGFKRQFDRTWQKTKNKIPFLSGMQEPYVGYKGEGQQNIGLAGAMFGDNFATRIADQMLSPGYYKEGNITPVDEEMNRLYQETGVDIYPNVSSGKVGDNRLSKEDFTKYQELYGKNTNDFYNEMIKSNDYYNLDDSQKAELLNDMKTLSRYIADKEIGGKDVPTNYKKVYEAYKTNGVKGVVDYYNTKAKADALDLSMSTYQKKEEEYNGGAKQYALDRQSAEKLGFVNENGNVNVDAYDKAVAIVGNDIPALKTYQDYTSQGFTKMDQKIPYLINDSNFTNEQKGMLITNPDPSKLEGEVVTNMYNLGGYEGVYYWYLLKYLADNQYGDGNGSVKKAEREALFNSNDPYLQMLSQDMYDYLYNAKKW